MISYKKLFKQFSYIIFVLPNNNRIIKKPALISKCHVFSIENFGSSIEAFESKRRYDDVPVNGYNGCDNCLTVPKKTYYKLWRSKVISV